MLRKLSGLFLLVFAATPVSTRPVEANLRLPVIEIDQALEHANRFGDGPVALCSASPLRSQLWPLELRGAEPFPRRSCLIGRVTKMPEQSRGRSWVAEFAFVVDPALQRLMEATPCLPAKTLEGAKVVSILRGSGARGHSSSYRFTGDTDGADLIAVGASAAGPPLVAVLAATRSTIWDLSAVPPGRLRAVLLVGTRGQAVGNVPHGVKVRFLTPEANDVACGCPDAFYRGNALTGLAALIRTSLTSEPELIDGRDPAAISLDKGPPPRPRPIALPPEALQSAQRLGRDDVPPGMAGLAKLFQEGAIRRARQADVDAWLAARERAHLPTVVLGPDNVFVVMRAITVPTGLYGSASTRFIVPAGIAAPADPGSHNTYYSIADGRCKGSGSQCP